MRIAKTCEGCYRYRNGKCLATDLEVKNMTPRFKCPLEFHNEDKIPMEERHKNKAYLFRQHIVMRKTKKQIAKELGVSEANIFYYMKKYKIKTRLVWFDNLKYSYDHKKKYKPE